MITLPMITGFCMLGTTLEYNHLALDADLHGSYQDLACMNVAHFMSISLVGTEVLGHMHALILCVEKGSSLSRQQKLVDTGSLVHRLRAASPCTILPMVLLKG